MSGAAAAPTPRPPGAALRSERYLPWARARPAGAPRASCGTSSCRTRRRAGAGRGARRGARRRAVATTLLSLGTRAARSTPRALSRRVATSGRAWCGVWRIKAPRPSSAPLSRDGGLLQFEYSTLGARARKKSTAHIEEAPAAPPALSPAGVASAAALAVAATAGAVSSHASQSARIPT